ncbi:MAG TPA: SprB repeat-containing protein, partial [Chryseolinea sp.]|nr:SprB repeat-containing protein [Chryseolinea sp.]
MKKNYTILMVLLCLLMAVTASAHKRKKPTCNGDAYSTEIVKETQISESCIKYEIKVSYDGTRAYGLSHYSLAIPCGEVKDLWNSEGWKMVFGKDRTTGVYGLKIDDISGFGERKADSFTIKFTWCSSSSCIKDLGVVAYKFGQCSTYDTLNTEKPDTTTQTCSTLLASLQKKNATCSSSNDGDLQVVVQDGAAPFVYSWSNGANTSAAQNLAAGKYSVTIKDANGNVLTLSEEITSSPPINITGAVLNPACSGAVNGSIDVTATGGTGTYTYAWSNGSTDQDLTGVASGVYTVKVTDAAGCFAEKTFALTNGALIAVQSSLRHPDCTQNNGAIDITPTTGVSPYTYLWSNGATTQDLQNVGAGNHSVKVTDALGCSVDKTFTLRLNNTLSVTHVVTPTSCLGDSSGA